MGCEYDLCPGICFLKWRSVSNFCIDSSKTTPCRIAQPCKTLKSNELPLCANQVLAFKRRVVFISSSSACFSSSHFGPQDGLLCQRTKSLHLCCTPRANHTSGDSETLNMSLVNDFRLTNTLDQNCSVRVGF